MRQGEGTGKALGRKPDAGQELAFSPPQARGLATLRVGRIDSHLSVIIHSVLQYRKASCLCVSWESKRKGSAGNPKQLGRWELI